uniref:Uncharacterized protein n=1 Tax=Erpetoichthys calabaricus TaxID=27687 RepID=A0A8C4SJC7_ERPCA
PQKKKCIFFFFFFLNLFDLYISKVPLIFFLNNCISAQVIHYNMKPCFCILTSEMLAVEACTCNNEKSINIWTETTFFLILVLYITTMNFK